MKMMIVKFYRILYVQNYPKTFLYSNIINIPTGWAFGYTAKRPFERLAFTTGVHRFKALLPCLIQVHANENSGRQGIQSRFLPPSWEMQSEFRPDLALAAADSFSSVSLNFKCINKLLMDS